jgi:hypothetical protein
MDSSLTIMTWNATQPHIVERLLDIQKNASRLRDALGQAETDRWYCENGGIPCATTLTDWSSAPAGYPPSNAAAGK